MKQFELRVHRDSFTYHQKLKRLENKKDERSMTFDLQCADCLELVREQNNNKTLISCINDKYISSRLFSGGDENKQERKKYLKLK